MSINELKNELGFLQWGMGFSFRIEEVSCKNGTKVYEVECLDVEIDNEIVLFSDAGSSLIDNCSVLLCFDQDKVIVNYDEIKREFYLDFKDVYVKISCFRND